MNSAKSNSVIENALFQAPSVTVLLLTHNRWPDQLIRMKSHFTKSPLKKTKYNLYFRGNLKALANLRVKQHIVS